VDIVKDNIKEYERTTSIAVKLQAIVAEAERIAVSETIDTLNLYVQSYLTRFADNIQVDLVFDGSKLTTDVIVNGHDADISTLSGGEIARVILAFTLALAEIHDINLLMLDESMASLDQDTTTTVIETIRTNYSGKVICIAHQTMTGIFDHVIEL
jgi:DNA repair exonuclease SbcCD ATPase subunit